MMRRLLLVIIFILLPAVCWSYEYVLVKGNGVEVCEEYGKNLNSLKPPLSYARLERKLNTEFKEFSKPKLEKMYYEDVESEKLFPMVNRFLWERDANPIYYFPVTEWKKWRGTQKQYDRAKKTYNASRKNLLAVGLPIVMVDIDNDGKIENLCFDSGNNAILMVLNDDKTNIDLQKTALVLQHPSRKAQGERELTADGKIVDDAMHTLSYDVFLYKQKTYFDLYIDLSGIFIEKESRIWGKLQPPAITTEKYIKRRATEPDGILQVFITENQKTEEICTFHYR